MVDGSRGWGISVSRSGEHHPSVVIAGRVAPTRGSDRRRRRRGTRPTVRTRQTVTGPSVVFSSCVLLQEHTENHADGPTQWWTLVGYLKAHHVAGRLRQRDGEQPDSSDLSFPPIPDHHSSRTPIVLTARPPVRRTHTTGRSKCRDPRKNGTTAERYGRLTHSISRSPTVTAGRPGHSDQAAISWTDQPRGADVVRFGRVDPARTPAPVRVSAGGGSHGSPAPGSGSRTSSGLKRASVDRWG